MGVRKEIGLPQTEGVCLFSVCGGKRHMLDGAAWQSMEAVHVQERLLRVCTTGKSNMWKVLYLTHVDVCTCERCVSSKQFLYNPTLPTPTPTSLEILPVIL